MDEWELHWHRHIVNKNQCSASHGFHKTEVAFPIGGVRRHYDAS